MLGPVARTASVTLFAFTFRAKVPSDAQETSTRRIVPVVVAGVTTHPVAVPVWEKSLLANPVIASENV